MTVEWTSKGDNLTDFDSVSFGNGSKITPVVLGGKPWLDFSIDDPTMNSDPWNAYKCRAEVQILGDWNKQISDVWYGARYLIPNDWRVDPANPYHDDFSYTCKISQLHEGQSAGHWGGLQFWVENDDQNIRVVAGYGSSMVIARNILVIKDTPWTLWVHTSTQAIEYYINGERIARAYGDFSMNPASQYKCRYFKVGIYCGINQNQKHLYASDFIAATTMEDLNEWFNGGEGLSFVNELNQEVAVYKRPIVVDEFVGNVPAGGSLDVEIDETKEQLVIKEVS